MMACVSPEVALLLLSSLWVLFPIAYCTIVRESSENAPSHPTSYKEIPYRPVESSPNNTPETRLSLKDKLWLVWKTAVLFIALFTSNISKMLLTTAVVTTIAFNNVPISPRNQYLFYLLASGIGDLIGRLYLLCFSLCGIDDKLTVRKTWILTFLNVSILIFMVSASWFRILTSFAVTVGIVMMNSLVSGIVMINTFQNAGEGLGMSEKKFCRALATAAFWIASINVSFIGLDTEASLRNHCLLYFPEVTCYTRSSTAWNPDTCVL